MWNNPHHAYFESNILTADPMELVRLMYQGAIAEVRNARAHLASGDIRARGKAIAKACAILTELTVALDRKSGGEYAERLAELYGYMMRRLSEANFQQSDELLAEVLALLTTLLEGWEGAQQQLQGGGRQQPAQTETPAHYTAPAAWQQSEVAHTPHAWSF